MAQKDLELSKQKKQLRERKKSVDLMKKDMCKTRVKPFEYGADQCHSLFLIARGKSHKR